MSAGNVMRAGPMENKELVQILARLDDAIGAPAEASGELAFLQGRIQQPMSLLRDPLGIEVFDFNVEGSSPAIGEDWRPAVLDRFVKPLKGLAQVLVGVEYQSPFDSASRRLDSLAVRCNQSQAFLAFRSGSPTSKVGSSAMRSFFEEARKKMDLPFIVRKRMDSFFLVDAGGEPIRTPIAGPGGSNPSAFTIELPSQEPPQLVALLDHWVDLFSDGAEKWTWRLSATDPKTDTAVRAIMGFFADHPLVLPADVHLAVPNSVAGRFGLMSEFLSSRGSLKIDSGRLKIEGLREPVRIKASRTRECWEMKVAAGKQEARAAFQELLGVHFGA